MTIGDRNSNEFRQYGSDYDSLKRAVGNDERSDKRKGHLSSSGLPDWVIRDNPVVACNVMKEVAARTALPRILRIGEAAS